MEMHTEAGMVAGPPEAQTFDWYGGMIEYYCAGLGAILGAICVGLQVGVCLGVWLDF